MPFVVGADNNVHVNVPCGCNGCIINTLSGVTLVRVKHVLWAKQL